MVARGLGNAVLITVNAPATLYVHQDHPHAPQTRIALLPATDSADSPEWSATTSAGTSTTHTTASGRHTIGSQWADIAPLRLISTTHTKAIPPSWDFGPSAQALPSHRLLEWAPKRAERRRAALAGGADLADDCVPLAAEGFAVAYGRVANRSAETEDLAGQQVIAKKDWRGLMNLLQAVPDRWPDPAEVTKALVHAPERLAVVRLARLNQHDHVILVVHGTDPDHPDRTGVWQIDFATAPAERRITSLSELRMLLSHAAAVALLDSGGLPMRSSGAAERRIPFRAALLDPGASPAATDSAPETAGNRGDFERTVTPRAMRRLQYARAAVEYLKSIIKDAGNQRQALQDTAFNTIMRVQAIREDSFWDLSALIRMPDRATMSAARSAYLHCGSCTEHADVVYAYLRANAPGEIIRHSFVEGADHNFVLIGDRWDPDDEVAVADGWPRAASACLWDDFHLWEDAHVNTSDNSMLRTVISRTADGQDNVDYVRRNIVLNRAGNIVAAWDLGIPREIGASHIADLLEGYGYELGPESNLLRRIMPALRQFAKDAQDAEDKSGWSEERLNLWCTSLVDSEVLVAVFENDSTHPDVIGEGIDNAKKEGGLEWVWDQQLAPAEDRVYQYIPPTND